MQVVMVVVVALEAAVVVVLVVVIVVVVDQLTHLRISPRFPPQHIYMDPLVEIGRIRVSEG